MTKETPRPKSNKSLSNGFVVDGYERALHGIESEVRPEIEQKYADEWNASGLIKRWMLSRRIEKEIRILVSERSRHISPEALY